MKWAKPRLLRESVILKNRRRAALRLTHIGISTQIKGELSEIKWRPIYYHPKIKEQNCIKKRPNSFGNSGTADILLMHGLGRPWVISLCVYWDLYGLTSQVVAESQPESCPNASPEHLQSSALDLAPTQAQALVQTQRHPSLAPDQEIRIWLTLVHLSAAKKTLYGYQVGIFNHQLPKCLLRLESVSYRLP